MTPLLHWKGPGKMERQDLARTKRPEIKAPQRPAVDTGEEPERRFVCTVDGCGKKFKKAMIMARHFNSTHEAEYEDKDSWREHHKEVWE